MAFTREMLTSKHLDIDCQTCPAPTNGLIRVYNMRFCPYGQKTLLVLAKKKIPCEIVNIHTRSKPGWYLEKSPLGKVPILEIDGGIICESDLTCDYLDEKYPSPSLHPKDPLKKFMNKTFATIFHNKITSQFKKLVYNGCKEEEMNTLIAEVSDCLDMVEKELSKRGTDFLGGEMPGMVDYLIWPWLERIPACSLCIKHEFMDDFPKLRDYAERMKLDEAVKAAHATTPSYEIYYNNIRAGNIVFDYPDQV